MYQPRDDRRGGFFTDTPKDIRPSPEEQTFGGRIGYVDVQWGKKFMNGVWRVLNLQIYGGQGCAAAEERRARDR